MLNAQLGKKRLRDDREAMIKTGLLSTRIFALPDNLNLEYMNIVSLVGPSTVVTPQRFEIWRMHKQDVFGVYVHNEFIWETGITRIYIYVCVSPESDDK